jgi:hypothetical protein
VLKTKQLVGAFVDYIHTHLRELMTNYGKIDILWYDVSWPLDVKVGNPKR